MTIFLNNIEILNFKSLNVYLAKKCFVSYYASSFLHLIFIILKVLPYFNSIKPKQHIVDKYAILNKIINLKLKLNPLIVARLRLKNCFFTENFEILRILVELKMIETENDFVCDVCEKNCINEEE